MSTYAMTHVSRGDGSPAMEVSSTDDTITLVNENGDQWTSPAYEWVAIGNETAADYDRWAEVNA